MTIPNSSANDAAFYGSDNTASRKPATGADLSNQVSLDGTRATAPNTSGRYLTQVGITDSSTANGKPADCDYITTRFNSHKDAHYEVTVRDGKIYINTGSGEQVTHPQAYHPANATEQQARDNNYYIQNQQPPVEAPPPPQYTYAQPNEGYPPPLPMPYPYREPYGYHREPYGYPHRQPWGYEHHGGFNLGGAIIGGLLGALGAEIGGGRGYYPPQGARYYQPQPIGYAPIQQASYGYPPQNYGYQPQNYASNDSRFYSGGYTPANYSRGYSPTSYDSYANNNNQQNDDSFYYS